MPLVLSVTSVQETPTTPVSNVSKKKKRVSSSLSVHKVLGGFGKKNNTHGYGELIVHQTLSLNFVNNQSVDHGMKFHGNQKFRILNLNKY